MAHVTARGVPREPSDDDHGCIDAEVAYLGRAAVAVHLDLANWRGASFQLPAICRFCNHMYGSGVWLVRDQEAAHVDGRYPCTRCGAEGRIPNPLLIRDTAGREFELTRLRVIARTVRAANALTADQLQEAARILHELQDTSEGPTAAVRASREASDEVSSLLDLLPRNRSDYYAILALIVSVIALLPGCQTVAEPAASDADTERIVHEVIEQIAQQQPELLVPPTGTIELPPKPPPSAPCPCGSGQRYKVCCAGPAKTPYQLPPSQEHEGTSNDS